MNRWIITWMDGEANAILLWFSASSPSGPFFSEMNAFAETNETWHGWEEKWDFWMSPTHTRDRCCRNSMRQHVFSVPFFLGATSMVTISAALILWLVVWESWWNQNLQHRQHLSQLSTSRDNNCSVFMIWLNIDIVTTYNYIIYAITTL